MVTTPSAIAAYARSSAATASPDEIIRMAYERVITACDRATAVAAAGPSGWRQAFHDEMVRAQAILVELMSVLQPDHADRAVAELSGQLAALYQFAIDELVRANVHKDATAIDGARSIVDGLLEAWTAGVLGR